MDNFSSSGHNNVNDERFAGLNFHVSQFSGVLWKFFREYKCLSLIALNNEYLCTAYGQGNAKIFRRKLQWHWNHEYLAQRIFPVYSSYKEVYGYLVASYNYMTSYIGNLL